MCICFQSQRMTFFLPCIRDIWHQTETRRIKISQVNLSSFLLHFQDLSCLFFLLIFFSIRFPFGDTTYSMLGGLNRLLSVDRFLDLRCHSRLFSARWGSLFKASVSSQAGQPRPRALFVTV